MKKRIYCFIKGALLCLFCIACAYCLLREPEAVSDGIKNGLSSVGNVLLPTLFPFMTLAAFVENSGVSMLFGRIFSPITRFVFRLPEEASAAILMSFIGGYPVGGRMTEKLLKENRITKRQAARMYLFCVNSGPAFVLSTVGGSLLHSFKAGALLFCSVTLSSLIIGFASGILFAKPVDRGQRRGEDRNSMTVFEAVTKSASQSVSAFISVSSYVLVFSAACELIRHFSLSDSILALLFSVSEVTNGVIFACGKYSLPVIAAVIGFGGLCVHFQIMNGVLESGLEIKHFIASRAVSAALSSGICRVLLYLFPVDVSVFAAADNTPVMPLSVSLPCFVMFALMSVCLIFDIAPKKKV